MLTKTKETTIRGHKLNNPMSSPGLYAEPTNKLIDLVEHSVDKFSRPDGYHLRVRLGHGVTISVFLDRLNKSYSRPGTTRKKENTFTPLCLWTCENDPQHKDYDPDGIRFGSGLHYHVAIILDGRKATAKSLHTLRDQFVDEGLLLDMKVCPTTQEQGKAYCKSLKDEKERSEYIYWLTYICKVRTKEGFIGTGQRVWGSSQLPN